MLHKTATGRSLLIFAAFFAVIIFAFSLRDMASARAGSASANDVLLLASSVVIVAGGSAYLFHKEATREH